MYMGRDLPMGLQVRESQKQAERFKIDARMIVESRLEKMTQKQLKF